MENLLKILSTNLKNKEFMLKFVSIFKTFGNFLKFLANILEKLNIFRKSFEIILKIYSKTLK